MKRTDILAYTAGIIDGEGCINLNKTKLRVTVSNTKEWLCQWLRMRYGGCIGVEKNNKPSNWAVSYRWYINGKQAGVFLKMILPYLNLKKPQAEIAIRLQGARNGRGRRHLTEAEQAVIEAENILMHNLNKKGNF